MLRTLALILFAINVAIAIVGTCTLVVILTYRQQPLGMMILAAGVVTAVLAWIIDR